jgi:hypothetical protein
MARTTFGQQQPLKKKIYFKIDQKSKKKLFWMVELRKFKIVKHLFKIYFGYCYLILDNLFCFVSSSFILFLI